MSESPSLLLLEFLTWVAARRRTYAETMDAWRSNCPRHTVWEDALADGLIEFDGDAGKVRDFVVALSPRGKSLLNTYRSESSTGSKDEQSPR
jgi:hypothetical protein